MKKGRETYLQSTHGIVTAAVVMVLAAMAMVLQQPHCKGADAGVVVVRALVPWRQ